MNFTELLKQNGFEITEHNEKYLKVAELLGFDDVVKCIPFDLEILKKSYAIDTSFNNNLTPIKTWDSASGFYCKGADCFYVGSGLTRVYSKAGVTCFSNSNGVSLLKTVARKLVLDSLEAEKQVELKTPRGTFKGVEFATEQEARNAEYGYYFTDNGIDIYVKHTGKYSCEFAFVRRAC